MSVPLSVPYGCAGLVTRIMQLSEDDGDGDGGKKRSGGQEAPTAVPGVDDFTPNGVQPVGTSLSGVRPSMDSAASEGRPLLINSDSASRGSMGGGRPDKRGASAAEPVRPSGPTRLSAVTFAP